MALDAIEFETPILDLDAVTELFHFCFPRRLTFGLDFNIFSHAGVDIYNHFDQDALDRLQNRATMIDVGFDHALIATRDQSEMDREHCYRLPSRSAGEKRRISDTSAEIFR
jgi:hypothetical protein